MGCDIFSHLLKVTADARRHDDSGLVLSPAPTLTLPFTPLFLLLFLFASFVLPVFPPPPTPDNFPQMAHQKRFIERKYRQELKEMRREREQQEKESDEEDDCRK